MASEGSPWEDDPHLHRLNSTHNDFFDYLEIVTDYISIPIYSVAILADVLLMIVVLKYKRLRNRNNFYLLNFAVFHTCYIISTPLFYRVLDLFYESELGVHWYCVWIRVENFAMGLTVTFGGGYGIDALLEKIRPSWFYKYEARYLYLFSFLYFSHFLLYVIAAAVCLKRGFANNFNFYLLTTYYFALFAAVIYATYKKKEIDKNSTLYTPSKLYAVGVSAAVLLCWLPLFVFYNLIIVFKNVPNVEKVLWYLAFLPEYIVYCSSMITLYKLWRRSKYFRAAFRSVLRRQVASSDYDELNVSENEETISKPL